MTEETLSNKIMWDKKVDLTGMYGILQIGHVKNFIKKLKEKLRNMTGSDLMDMPEDDFKVIDKLAGDDLK